MANLMLSVMGAFAEFEKSLIHERQMEGMALARLAAEAYPVTRRTLRQLEASRVEKPERRRRGTTGGPTNIWVRILSDSGPNLIRFCESNGLVLDHHA